MLLAHHDKQRRRTKRKIEVRKFTAAGTTTSTTVTLCVGSVIRKTQQSAPTIITKNTTTASRADNTDCLNKNDNNIRNRNGNSVSTITSTQKMKTKEKEDTLNPQLEKVFYDNRIKRKNVLALNEKVAAIREYEKMPVYKRIGRLFHCSPDQIKRIVQQKDNILKAWEQRTRRCQDAKTLELKVVRVSMLGKAVYDWIRRMMYYKDFTITDGLIQKVALQFKSAMGLQNFFPHQEWCDKFRHSYKITANDSKLLNIGYTQGFSVQIKDVMKDVLSECTPYGKVADGVDSNVDNDEDDDDMGDSKSDRDCHNSDTKEHLVLTKATAVSTTTPQQPTVKMPHLQPIRQLVALPIKSNGGGMTQKVLVATPITPTTIQRAGNGSVGVESGTPMTMTIIPFTTLAQAQAQTQSQHAAQAVTTSTAASIAVVSATTRILATSQSVPTPIIEIKQEIKKEPEEIEIKHEYTSEDEDVPETSVTTAKTGTAAAELPEGAAVKVNSPSKNRLAEFEDASLIDDDNMALASLRHLIRQPILTAAVSSTRTARVKQKLTLRASTAENTLRARIPSLQQTITATEQTISLRTLESTQNACATNSAAQKRKRHSSTMPAPPPIQSCSEARRYLKLLEDFALYKENFRLIGLITRADEVLRELDGNNDVDID